MLKAVVVELDNDVSDSESLSSNHGNSLSLETVPLNFTFLAGFSSKRRHPTRGLLPISDGKKLFNNVGKELLGGESRRRRSLRSSSGTNFKDSDELEEIGPGLSQEVQESGTEDSGTVLLSPLKVVVFHLNLLLMSVLPESEPLLDYLFDFSRSGLKTLNQKSDWKSQLKKALALEILVNADPSCLVDLDNGAGNLLNNIKFSSDSSTITNGVGYKNFNLLDELVAGVGDILQESIDGLEKDYDNVSVGNSKDSISVTNGRKIRLLHPRILQKLVETKGEIIEAMKKGENINDIIVLASSDSSDNCGRRQSSVAEENVDDDSEVDIVPTAGQFVQMHKKFIEEVLSR